MMNMKGHATSTAVHPHTIEDVYEEVTALRELVERLVQPAAPEREWLSIEEAATLLCRSPQAVRARCRSRKIGAKIAGKWRIPRDQLFSQN
jgi:hypothetical protein